MRVVYTSVPLLCGRNMYCVVSCTFCMLLCARNTCMYYAITKQVAITWPFVEWLTGQHPFTHAVHTPHTLGSSVRILAISNCFSIITNTPKRFL